MDEIIETRFNNVPVLPVQQNLFNDINNYSNYANDYGTETAERC